MQIINKQIITFILRASHIFLFLLNSNRVHERILCFLFRFISFHLAAEKDFAVPLLSQLKREKKIFKTKYNHQYSFFCCCFQLECLSTQIMEIPAPNCRYFLFFFSMDFCFCFFFFVEK